MISVSKAKAEAVLNDVGEDKKLYSPVALTIVEKILVQYGAEFAEKVADNLNASGNIGSGALADRVIPELIKKAAEVNLKIRLLNYYDFVNKGVKGVKSSKNAPNSPYQFKNYGVPDTMKQSLRKYIESGKAKISATKNDKARGIGLERKGVNLMETRVNTLGYLIKAFGIKGSGYFDKAFNEVFKDFESIIQESVGEDIILNISGINLKGK